MSEELRADGKAFLMEGTRTAKVATLTPGGSPLPTELLVRVRPTRAIAEFDVAAW